MSKCTDIILSALDESKTVAMFDEWLKKEHQFTGTILKKLGPDTYGGSKWLGHSLYVGVVNMMNIKKIVEYFIDLPWETPDTVQLIIRDENDDIYSTYVPKLSVHYKKEINHENLKDHNS